MKNFVVAIISLIACSFSKQSFTQAPASNPVQLSIANTNAAHEYDLELSVRIKSKWKRPIAVPGSATWGILKFSDLNFLVVEVQKKVSGGFKDVSIFTKLDNIPDPSVDSLEKGDSITAKGFSLAEAFIPNKGSYRARVLCRFSMFNPGMKDLFSNWVYFRCEKDVPHIYGDTLRISGVSFRKRA